MIIITITTPHLAEQIAGEPGKRARRVEHKKKEEKKRQPHKTNYENITNERSLDEWLTARVPIMSIIYNIHTKQDLDPNVPL